MDDAPCRPRVAHSQFAAFFFWMTRIFEATKFSCTTVTGIPFASLLVLRQAIRQLLEVNRGSPWHWRSRCCR